MERKIWVKQINPINDMTNLYTVTSPFRLHCLNLAWTGMSAEDLRVICRRFPSSLERLNLSGCRNSLTDSSKGPTEPFSFYKPHTPAAVEVLGFRSVHTVCCPWKLLLLYYFLL